MAEKKRKRDLSKKQEIEAAARDLKKEIDPDVVYYYPGPAGTGIVGLPVACTLKQAQVEGVEEEFLAAIVRGLYRKTAKKATTSQEDKSE